MVFLNDKPFCITDALLFFSSGMRRAFDTPPQSRRAVLMLSDARCPAAAERRLKPWRL